ncbi:methylaspartate mutase accessory protein GlmL [uncultured Alistipes sp.]|jgi:hypothetical protein|uniref:methylaspartate mutase accessory protein GlmL n=1 Tax=uncultured Alistipes sp. TaxID=538949 RepID=UPI0025F4B01F|nr:methylaspartate mutase accessory protein GlmL [uncultured Alistipes sp.]
MFYLTVDFGSTYTKLAAIDAGSGVVVATANAFTTIETDIMEGYRHALCILEDRVGRIRYDRILCCSSAGGGLKMVSLGLVPALTAKAAKMAAASAGAKVVKTYSFEISKKEQQEIYDINPDLVLLCGGTDGGNKDVIVANARKLCGIDRNFTVVVAGNKSAADEVSGIFDAADTDYVVTDNVMPSFNQLDINPAKSAIREVFIRKIIDAKGLSGVQAMADNEIMPTPLAVMAGCELLSRGTRKEPGIGDFMAIDLGGATTDVYSMSEGLPSWDSVVIKGLPEPFSKRTVEGDLGMRYSLKSLLDELHPDSLEVESGIPADKVAGWVGRCCDKPDLIAAGGSEESAIEELLARKAIEIAVERHCGFIESSFTPMGEVFSITGKDLTAIPYVIGIGGAIINSANPTAILRGAEYDHRKPHSMKPRRPGYMLDARYVFAAMGLLSTVDPDLALKIMKNEIKSI